MKQLKRCFLIALPIWALWLALIAYAAPAKPTGWILNLFFASFLVALAGSLWAHWHAFPNIANKTWRRTAHVSLGLATFVLIVMVGHVLGVALSARLT